MQEWHSQSFNFFLHSTNDRKHKFLIRDTPLGVTLAYEKFVFSIVSWTKWKKRLETQVSLVFSFVLCAYLILPRARLSKNSQNGGILSPVKTALTIWMKLGTNLV